VYDIPNPNQIVSCRDIRCIGYKFRIPESARGFHDWKFAGVRSWKENYAELERVHSPGVEEGGLLVPDVRSAELVNRVPQNPNQASGSTLNDIILPGSEGWILRNPYVGWLASRNTSILKIKARLEFQARVLGIKPGKGWCSGMIGSLHLQPLGDMQSVKPFHCSGMDKLQRVLGTFKEGDVVMVESMGLTHKGIPREPRLL